MSLINTKFKARALGIVCSLFGFGYTFYLWYQTLFVSGMYYPKASFFLPFMGMFFLSIALDPATKQETFEKYGTEQMAWKFMPKRQKIIIVLGVVLGVLNYLLASGRI